MGENEDLRRTLLAEMDRAEENLKDLEVQFLEMPNPFADEVTELRQGYDDNMRVVKELSKSNFELTEARSGQGESSCDPRYAGEKACLYHRDARQGQGDGNSQAYR